jgi:hypothetical protein
MKTLLRLLVPLNFKVQKSWSKSRASCPALEFTLPIFHLKTQSVQATGGVYNSYSYSFLNKLRLYFNILLQRWMLPTFSLWALWKGQEVKVRSTFSSGPFQLVAGCYRFPTIFTSISALTDMFVGCMIRFSQFDGIAILASRSSYPIHNRMTNYSFTNYLPLSFLEQGRDVISALYVKRAY